MIQIKKLSKIIFFNLAIAISLMTTLAFQNCSKSSSENTSVISNTSTNQNIPTPTPTPPSTGKQSSTDIDITDLGAVADGKTNNQKIINTALATAKKNKVNVYVPSGSFAFSGLIQINDSVKLYGNGESSNLIALDPMNSSIYLNGTGPSISQLKLSLTPNSVTRQTTLETTRVCAYFANQFTISYLTIVNGASGGIMVYGASNGNIFNNTISDTLADSIHITNGSSFMTVTGNVISNSGDDGIAVVSYATEPLSHDVTAKNNSVLNNKWGRNMSVVGGYNVLYENNTLDGNPNAACVYISQETSWNTNSVQNVTVQYNTLKNCGNNNIGHSAIMYFTEGDTALNSNVKFIRNNLILSNVIGIRVFGKIQSSLLESNKITGASQNYDIQANIGITLTPYSNGEVGAK